MDPKSYKTSKDRHTKGGSGNLALTAVALQDHWSRTLSLGVTRGPRSVGLGPAARAKQRKDVRPVIDTGRFRQKAKKASKPEVEEEYVLDAKPPPLTLAQKFGLVDAPDQPLSEAEWKNVKEKSNKRDDSHQPCVICKEDFGLQEQVLLSCTHVFHRACLQAFERFTGKKTCPMCRREQYQTRLIHEGAKLHRLTCVTRIQAAWRGYVVRCWYRKLRETHPPTDPKLRKKFFEDKLQTITDRMVRSCDFNVGDFLSEIDRSLKASRDVFRNFDAMFTQITEEEWDKIQLKAVERGHGDCPICLTSLKTKGLTTETQEAKNTTSKGTKYPRKKQNPLLILQNYPLSKSKPGNIQESLSMNSVETGTSPRVTEPEAGPGGDRSSRTTVLLSCSHVFHETCLDMLEHLAMGEIKRTCPVCRTAYQKKVIHLA
ncbi:RING finger protein 32-like [Haliotis cracherodii]|uniref:RING finger protein 32-like n=1 Tax=Haliotis cracherodii TaxID=6455 RepID=UPI0039EC9223